MGVDDRVYFAASQSWKMARMAEMRPSIEHASARSDFSISRASATKQLKASCAVGLSGCRSRAQSQTQRSRHGAPTVCGPQPMWHVDQGSAE